MTLEWKLSAKEVTDAINKGLLAGAELVLQESNKLVPLETGNLLRSGRAGVDNGEAYVTYDAPYAEVQHERVDFIHKNGREAKFLEKAANRNATKVGQVIAETIRENL